MLSTLYLGRVRQSYLDSDSQILSITTTTTTTMPPRPQRRASAYVTTKTAKEDESGLSWPAQKRWSLSPSYAPYVEHDLERDQTYNHAYSFAAYNYGASANLARPRWQSIPSDVTNHPRSSLSSSDDERVELTREAQPQGKGKWNVEVRTEPVNSDSSKVHAIDPSCFGSIVTFDYSCLDDLDEELILRPRSAFEELCWTAAVRNPPRLSQYIGIDEQLPSPLPSSLVLTPKSSLSSLYEDSSRSVLTESIPPRLPTPSLSFSSLKDTPSVQISPQVEVLSVNDTVSTRTRTVSYAGTHHDVPAMMKVNGGKGLNVLEDSGSKAIGRKVSVQALVTSEPITQVEDDDPSQLDQGNCTGYYDYYELNLNRKHDIEADARSSISFDDDDDTPNHSPQKRKSKPILQGYAYPHAEQLLYPNLQAGFTNPEESVAFFPIPSPVPKSTTKLGRSGIKLSGKRIGSSVSKLLLCGFSSVQLAG
jgi:hypothetical protein